MLIQMAGRDSDDDDLESLRLAALQSLKTKESKVAEISMTIASTSAVTLTQQGTTHWSAVGGRKGGSRLYSTGVGRAGRNRKGLFGSPRGSAFVPRGGGMSYTWNAPHVVNRSNLISIVPIGAEDTAHQNSFQQQAKQPALAEGSNSSVKGELDDASKVPSKFSRYEHSDSDESEEEEDEEGMQEENSKQSESESGDDVADGKADIEEQEKEEEVTPEEPDEDVILMQDEDSLGKLLDEFETELGNDKKSKPKESKHKSRNVPSAKDDKSPSLKKRHAESRLAPAKKNVSVSPVEDPHRLFPVKERKAGHGLSKVLKPVSPRRSLSPVRMTSPQRLRSLTPERRWFRQFSPSRRSPPPRHFTSDRRTPPRYYSRSPPTRHFSPVRRISPGRRSPPPARYLSPVRRSPVRHLSPGRRSPHPRHLSPGRRSPPPRHLSPGRRSPPRRLSPGRRSPFSRHVSPRRRSPPPSRHLSPLIRYASPVRHVSPGHTRCSPIKKRSLTPTRGLSPSLKPVQKHLKRNVSPHDAPYDRYTAQVPYSPKKSRISVSPPSPKQLTHSRSHSTSSCLSLSPSPPPRVREHEYRRHTAPLAVVSLDRQRNFFEPEPTQVATKKSKLDSPKKSKKSSKSKSKSSKKLPKETSIIEPKKDDTVLEARRRKFESAEPIHVECNKKIRLKNLKKENEFDESAGASDDGMRVSSAEPEEKKLAVLELELEREEHEDSDSLDQGESSEKADDLRAELKRRRAERLYKAGNVHHILPTRLVQSALHGAVGKAAALQRRDKIASKESVKKSGDPKGGRAENRKVVLVSKQDEDEVAVAETTADPSLSAEQPRTSVDKKHSTNKLHPNVKDAVSDQVKGPVHSRLGSVAVAATRSRRHKNKSSKSRERGEEHTIPGKAKRFRLKRSKLEPAATVADVEKVMCSHVNHLLVSKSHTGKCYKLLLLPQAG